MELNNKPVKVLYDFEEMIKKLGYGEIGILIVACGCVDASKVGTMVYYDKEDLGILKYKHSDDHVVIAKDDNDCVNLWVIAKDTG